MFKRKEKVRPFVYRVAEVMRKNKTSINYKDDVYFLFLMKGGGSRGTLFLEFTKLRDSDYFFVQISINREPICLNKREKRVLLKAFLKLKKEIDIRAKADEEEELKEKREAETELVEDWLNASL